MNNLPNSPDSWANRSEVLASLRKRLATPVGLAIGTAMMSATNAVADDHQIVAHCSPVDVPLACIDDCEGSGNCYIQECILAD